MDRNHDQLSAKDRELAETRAQLQQAQQQRLEDEQRHSRALAEVKQSQASLQQPTVPGLDAAALQRVIDEVQRHRVSKDDIKDLVGHAVRAQLTGVAKTIDIDSAASRMERGLSSIPPGASVAQVQDVVQQKLEQAVQSVAKHMPRQQQRLDAPRPQERAPWQTDLSGAGVDTRSAFGRFVEADDDTRTVASTSRRSVPLPAPSQAGSALTVEALATLPRTQRSSSRYSKPRASVTPTARNAIVRTGYEQSQNQSETDARTVVSTSSRKSRAPPAPSQAGSSSTPLTMEALASLPQSRDSSSRASKSRASVAPNAGNAIVRTRHDPGQPENVSVQVPLPAQQPGGYAVTEAALSQLRLETGSEARSSPSGYSKSRASVQPSPHNAVAKAGHQGDQGRSSKGSTMSVQPSPRNALARPTPRDTHEPDHEQQRSHKGPSVSARSSASNAMTSPSRSTMHSTSGGPISRTASHQETPELPDLPDDFPDNASQNTTWQRRRTSKPSKLRQSQVQLEDVPEDNEEDEGGRALVKQSRDLARKSGR